jgi:hypothetical protein
MSEAPVPVDEEVPSELQTRDQWLLWDKDAQRRRPFTLDGDRLVGASWNNPADWLSYEEAHAYASSHESVGIGYVLANDNDDYPRGVYGGLDLDGCIADGRGTKEWLESIQPFLDRDAFVERSPSGTGLHVIIAGFSPPEWWRNTGPEDAGDHEGVEAYGSKFFAFTGDIIDGAGLTIIDDGDYVTNWLQDQYERLTGEQPWTESVDTTPPDSHTESPTDTEPAGNAEDIAGAVDRLDARDVAEQTIVHRWNDEHTAGDGLRAFYPTWGPNSNGTANIVGEDGWTDTGTDGGAGGPLEMALIDLGELSHHGCSWGDASGDLWWDAVDHLRDLGFAIPEYEPPEQTAGSDGVDSTSSFDEDEVERGSDILDSMTSPEDPVGDLLHHNGGYAIKSVNRDDEGNIVSENFDPVCNFTLETLSFLSIEDRQTDEFRVRVHPNHPTEQPYDVRIQPSVFNSPDTFRSEVVTGRTTWFDPSNRKGIRTVSILRYLRETVGAQPAPHRTGQPYVGLSDDGTEFVTPAGSLTADGWTEDPEYEFYSIGGDSDEHGPLAQKWQLGPDTDREVADSDVARICELAWQTRKPDRGLPMLAWHYAAPLKTFVHGWEREFPMLSAYGDTGTGKTTTLETFNAMFGGDGEPLSSSDTHFTIQKHFAESRGFPIWVDEYKPTEMVEGDTNHLHQRLKEVTKERSMPKGRPDLGMDTLELRAPVVLSGEQKIADAPVRRRSIMTNLAREPTQDGTETKAAFAKLAGVAYEDESGDQQYPDGYDLLDHARAYYEWVLEQGEAELQQWWYDARERMKTVLEALAVTLDASEELAVQTVLFGLRVHEEFATAMGANAENLPGDDAVTDAVNHMVENIGKGGQRREHADEWLEALTLAASEEYVEHGEQHRVYETSDGEVLAVHMPTAFSAVKRYVRDSNLEGEYTILSKRDYLNSFGNKADAPGTYVVATNKKTRKLGSSAKRAVHFDHERVAEKLGGDFDINAFLPPEEREDEEEADEDRQPSNEAVLSLADLSVVDGYSTITAEVVAHTNQENESSSLAYEGTLRDATDMVDYVDFEGIDALDELDEGECYRISNVKLVISDQYGPQLQFHDAATEIEPIQKGVGYTGTADPGDSRQIDEAAADGGRSQLEAPPDDAAGDTAQVDRIYKLVADAGGELERSAILAKAGSRFGMGPDTAEKALRSGLASGRLQEPQKDVIRTV